MGREIKRVALDFAWPLGETWEGYLNPHGRPCPEKDRTCFNGQTADAQWLDAIIRFMDVVARYGREPERQSVGYFSIHPYMVNFPQYPSREKPRELTEIEKRNKLLYGHDPSNLVLPTKGFADFFDKLAAVPEYHLNLSPWEVQKRLLTLAGLDPETWGACPVCEGETLDPAIRKTYEEWEQIEPPAGEGWQVWETVSEGSPITPVFATAEELAKHLSTVGTSWKSDPPVSYEAAMRFIKAGWMISAVSNGRDFASGLGVAETLPE